MNAQSWDAVWRLSATMQVPPQATVVAIFNRQGLRLSCCSAWLSVLCFPLIVVLNLGPLQISRLSQVRFSYLTAVLVQAILLYLYLCPNEIMFPCLTSSVLSLVTTLSRDCSIAYIPRHRTNGTAKANWLRPYSK